MRRSLHAPALALSRRGLACVRVGERSYDSGLFVEALAEQLEALVDERNLLQRVDPELRFEVMRPGCGGGTRTFDGVRWPQKW